MRPRAKQLVWLVVAAGLLAAAGGLQRLLATQRQRLQLVPPGDIVAREHPEIALLTVAPGGLRALLVNFLWIRSQEYHQQGRHFDAMQLASLICRLQPRFSGVWSFHSWNMAWNVSSTARTPQERWRWVYNGIRLLRDEGIRLNPTSVLLYRELAYIFFEKMGGNLDEMHREYKQMWAARMQHLLGAPPYGTTEEVVEAFRPVAEAPLDRSPQRQGRTDRRDRVVMQADQLRRITDADAAGADEKKGGYFDPKAAEYVRRLAALGVDIDQGLLDAYNRYSLDEAAQSVRPELMRIELKTERDQALSALLNSPQYASARRKLLAFVRAQILWHEYKMDPAWMLHLMEDYALPLDWRLAVVHGLYWITYGIHATGHMETGEIESMNVDRQLLNPLKHLTWNGLLAYEEDPARPEYPRLSRSADYRYIAPTQKTYDRIIKQLVIARNLNRKPGEPIETYKTNKLRDGHLNYLSAAIEMLVGLRRRREAQGYLDWINDVYAPTEPQWKLPPDDFVFRQLAEDDSPIPLQARNQLTSSLQTAMVLLASGDERGYQDTVRYARRVYRAFQDSVPERVKLPPLADYAAAELAKMLVRPKAAGFDLSFDARIRLYGLIGRYWPTESADRPGPQLIVYDGVKGYLRRVCDARKMEFERAFPPPPFLEEYRRRRAIRLRPSPAGRI